jgi:hypothetical protein
MRKIPVVLITLILLSGGLLSGCTKQDGSTHQATLDEQNIRGVWANVTFWRNVSGFNQSTMLVYNFTDTRFNYSAYYLVSINGNDKRYYSFTEGNYELKEGNLLLTNATKIPPLNYIYQYSFNSNYTTLTLTNNSGFYLVFWKLS